MSLKVSRLQVLRKERVFKKRKKSLILYSVHTNINTHTVYLQRKVMAAVG